ncbi:MAG: SOS response-associated peptidase [Balneolaceae bacterium]|nr:SOS response-associated peptidase [Balneolaceae bacterium]
MDEIDHFLGVLERKGEITPNYNVAPTHTMPVAYVDEDGKRIAENMHWGFMGWKPKDGKKPFLPINTRDDSLTKKPMWQRAFQSRRCLIPMNGFYEWQGPKGKKTPHYIHPKNDGELLVAAGIFSDFSPIDGTRSYSIITTKPNSIMESIHDRMPAFLHPSEFDAWLDPDRPDDLLLDMLQPYPDDALSEHIVSKAVGNVRNNEPGLVEPSTLF